MAISRSSTARHSRDNESTLAIGEQVRTIRKTFSGCEKATAFRSVVYVPVDQCDARCVRKSPHSTSLGGNGPARSSSVKEFVESSVALGFFVQHAGICWCGVRVKRLLSEFGQRRCIR